MNPDFVIGEEKHFTSENEGVVVSKLVHADRVKGVLLDVFDRCPITQILLHKQLVFPAHLVKSDVFGKYSVGSQFFFQSGICL